MSKISHRVIARVLNTPVRTPSLRNRVIHRYANVADNVATEFSSPEAMQEYLKAHPGADPKNHSVKKPDEGAPAPAPAPAKGDASSALDNLIKNHPHFDKDDVEDWKKQISDAKGDPAKLKKIQEEIDSNDKSQSKRKEMDAQHAKNVETAKSEHKKLEKAIEKLHEDFPDDKDDKLMRNLTEGLTSLDQLKRDKDLGSQSHFTNIQHFKDMLDRVRKYYEDTKKNNKKTARVLVRR